MSSRRPADVMSGREFFDQGLQIHVNRAQESFELREHSHEFAEVTYISQGAGTHYIEGEAVPVRQGSVFVIPEGHSHVFRPQTTDKNKPLVVYNCLFTSAYLSELRAAFPAFLEVGDFFGDPTLRWFEVKDAGGVHDALFQELYREYYGRPPGFAAVLSALTVQLLTVVYRHRLLPSEPKESLPALSIADAIAHMTAHYASPMKLGELADLAKLSERQFGRLLRQHTGMSFTAYLQHLRMKAACRLLTESTQRIADVAAAVGYGDLKFFNRLFRAKTGVSPRAYRSEHANRSQTR
ncbi:AraC family transcriptional regulator [Paenibacillus xanthanilyticus]|uniref:Helix-turn-helix domain-containing protein n=1 Tax=Paenibacillus xanthanilyticus TaxID=1783531 RepID=A0ABV8K0R4_9BACL